MATPTIIDLAKCFAIMLTILFAFSEHMGIGFLHMAFLFLLKSSFVYSPGVFPFLVCFLSWDKHKQF